MECINQGKLMKVRTMIEIEEKKESKAHVYPLGQTTIKKYKSLFSKIYLPCAEAA